MIDFEDLKYAHKPDCNSKDSTNTEHRNIICDEQSEVEYDCYCKECGAFLYCFCYGHYER
jgi:hypothetical protein